MDFDTSIEKYCSSYPLTEEVYIRTVMKFLVGDMKNDISEFYCDDIDEADIVEASTVPVGNSTTNDCDVIDEVVIGQDNALLVSKPNTDQEIGGRSKLHIFEKALRDAWGLDICEVTLGDDEFVVNMLSIC